MRYKDDDGSRTMQRRIRQWIEDDAWAQTTTDRGRREGTDDNWRRYKGETETTDGNTETTAKLTKIF